MSPTLEVRGARPLRGGTRSRTEDSTLRCGEVALLFPSLHMTVLLIGGTGFIGRAVTERLVNAGHTVTVFHRGETSPTLPDAVTIRHGDRDDPAALRGALDAAGPDAVLDVIPYTQAQAETLTDLCADRTDRLVALSSGDVYRQYDGLRGASGRAFRGPAAPLGLPHGARHAPDPHRAQVCRGDFPPASTRAVGAVGAGGVGRILYCVLRISYLAHPHAIRNTQYATLPPPPSSTDPRSSGAGRRGSRRSR